MSIIIVVRSLEGHIIRIGEVSYGSDSGLTGPETVEAIKRIFHYADCEVMHSDNGAPQLMIIDYTKITKVALEPECV